MWQSTKTKIRYQNNPEGVTFYKVEIRRQKVELRRISDFGFRIFIISLYKISDSKNPIFTLQLLAYKFGLKSLISWGLIPIHALKDMAIDVNINKISSIFDHFHFSTFNFQFIIKTFAFRLSTFAFFIYLCKTNSH